MERYARQIILPQVGTAGQQRLARARVLVVGAGGLGCPVLHYLAAAGVGRITIVDGDVVAVSNLHRQLLYSTADVGRGKAATAARRLREQGHACEVEAVDEHFGPRNAKRLVNGHDLVVDCTDDLAARYLINDACVQAGLPFVHGSLHRFSGQVAVFNHAGGPTYRCAFPDEPGPGQVPDCAEAGVLGVLPGVVGTLQATEVLKLLLGTGDLIDDGLLLVDLLRHDHRRMRLRRDPAQELKALERELDSEPSAASACAMEVEEMAPAELLERLAAGERWQLLDVRMPHEVPQVDALRGHAIPLDELPRRAHELDRDVPVLVYCAGGVRSRHAGRQLQRMGFGTVRSLRGGVRAWPASDQRIAEPFHQPT